jgi:ketosteroid isomerase-like protein
MANRQLAREVAMSDIGQALERLCDAFNAHDLDRVMGFFADDCVLEMPRGSQPWGARSEGKDNVRKALAGRFEGLPDVHYGNARHFVDRAADTGISKWTLTGTRRDGQRIEVCGCDFYTFRAGKVVRKDSYWKIVE